VAERIEAPLSCPVEVHNSWFEIAADHTAVVLYVPI